MIKVPPLKWTFRSFADPNPDKLIELEPLEDTVSLGVLRDGRGHVMHMSREEFVNLIRWEVAFLSKDERKTLLNDMIDLELRNQ